MTPSPALIPSLPQPRTIHSLFHSLAFLLLVLIFILSPARSLTTSPTTSSSRPVAVVTGGSRGIGRGIALELGSAGYTVYVLGRSSSSAVEPPSNQRPVDPSLTLTVESAALDITSRGGLGRALPCDLSRDDDIERAFDVIKDETGGRLDVLVCSAYTTPSSGRMKDDFWVQGMDMWDAVNGVGLRQVYKTCIASVPLMMDTAKKQQQHANDNVPLICLVSSFGGKAYTFNVAYGVGKAAIDRLASDMAFQLKSHNVATVSLYPGLVKTEANVQMVKDGTWDAASGGLDMSFGETPSFSGKAVVELVQGLKREELMKRSGTVQVVAELARERGFTDVDGTTPASIRSLRYLLPNFAFKAIEEKEGKQVPRWIKENVPDVLLPWSVFGSAPPE